MLILGERNVSKERRRGAGERRREETRLRYANDSILLSGAVLANLAPWARFQVVLPQQFF